MERVSELSPGEPILLNYVEADLVAPYNDRFLGASESGAGFTAFAMAALGL